MPRLKPPFPGGGRPLWLPDDGEQRREHRRHADDHAARRGVVLGARAAEERRHQAVLHFRPREQAMQRRGGAGHPVARADRHAMRAACAAAGTICSPSSPGGSSVPLHPEGDLRHGADGFRQPARREERARHRGRDRDGQVDRRHPRDLAARAVLQARELRPMHALPRGHRLDDAGDGAHGRRAARSRKRSTRWSR